MIAYAGNHSAAILALNFVLYHEIAHALVDVLDIPTVGNYESTADSLAMVLAAQTGRSEDAVLAGVFFRFEQTSYGDEHIGGEDRAGDLICWALGSDSRLFYLPSMIEYTQPYAEAGRDCDG